MKSSNITSELVLTKAEIIFKDKKFLEIQKSRKKR